MNKILVVAAHPDDEILGQGATIRRFVEEGKEVRAIILGTGLTSRRDTEESELSFLKECAKKSADIIGYKSIDFFDFPDNKFDSIPLLDIIKCINVCIKKYSIDTIFTHHYGDLNIDHQKTFEATITAARPFNGCDVSEIYAFETLSSTEWNFKYGDNTFKPNFFVDVCNTIKYKLKAMECYVSEGGEFPHPRSIKAIEVSALRWGSCCDRKYAEAFELIRKIS